MKLKNDDDYRFFHLRLSKVMHEKLKTAADDQERSVSGIVKYIISQFLKQQSY